MFPNGMEGPQGKTRSTWSRVDRILKALQWNKPSIDFYVECLKAENLVEWDTMRIEGQEGIDRLVSFRQ
jgi:hypothetical protein